MSNWINEVQDWNETRDNLRYSPSLEYSMLDEELGEYMEAGISGNRVDQADALGDILVVATGALYKLCGGDKEKFDDIMLAITAANNLISACIDNHMYHGAALLQVAEHDIFTAINKLKQFNNQVYAIIWSVVMKNPLLRQFIPYVTKGIFFHHLLK